MIMTSFSYYCCGTQCGDLRIRSGECDDGGRTAVCVCVCANVCRRTSVTSYGKFNYFIVFERNFCVRKIWKRTAGRLLIMCECVCVCGDCVCTAQRQQSAAIEDDPCIMNAERTAHAASKQCRMRQRRRRRCSEPGRK